MWGELIPERTDHFRQTGLQRPGHAFVRTGSLSALGQKKTRRVIRLSANWIRGPGTLKSIPWNQDDDTNKEFLSVGWQHDDRIETSSSAHSQYVLELLQNAVRLRLAGNDIVSCLMESFLQLPNALRSGVIVCFAFLELKHENWKPGTTFAI